MRTRVVVRTRARDGSIVELQGVVRSATEAGRQIIATQIAEQLGFFAYEHLPPAAQARSKPFGDLAREQVASTTWSFELVECLRLLKLAKDAAVRAGLAPDAPAPEVRLAGSGDSDETQS